MQQMFIYLSMLHIMVQVKYAQMIVHVEHENYVQMIFVLIQHDHDRFIFVQHARQRVVTQNLLQKKLVKRIDRLYNS